MKFRLFCLIGIYALMLTGCAGTPPQKPVPFSVTTFQSPVNRVGVVMTQVPKTNTYFPGANCLLCIAAASAANSTMTDYVRTLPNDDLAAMKEQVAEALKKKSADVVIISDLLKLSDLPSNDAAGTNIARKNFSAFHAKYNIDKLVVVDFNFAGVQRPYANYFPASEPKAVVSGFAYMINLGDNSYEWYQPLNETKATDGAWDEAPKFPALTNAYFQALELAKDDVLHPLGL
jgi:hypothetical protein